MRKKSEELLLYNHVFGVPGSRGRERDWSMLYGVLGETIWRSPMEISLLEFCEGFDAPAHVYAIYRTLYGVLMQCLYSCGHIYRLIDIYKYPGGM